MGKARAAICLLVLLLVRAAFSAAGSGQDRYEIEVRGAKISFREDPQHGLIVLEGETLRRLPALQVVELIALAANMNFAVRGIFQADPQMQGFNQEQIAVLVDGIPVNNAQTGHHNFLLPVAPDDIARIEVLRGGFSARFGTAGGGGLVNIVTAAGNRVSVRRSSSRTTDASASAGSENLRIAAGLTQTSGYDDGLDGRRSFVRASGRLTGKASFLDFQAGYVGAAFGASRFYGPYPSGEEISRALGAISAGGRLGSGLAGYVRISGQASRDDFRLFRQEPERYRNIHDTRQISAEATIRGKARAFEYSAGLTTTQDGIESDGTRDGLAAPALGRHRRSFHSLSLSTEKESERWFGRAALEAGFGDYRGVGGSIVLGRRLGRAFRLTGAVARSFRIPTYTEMYYSDPVHLSDPAIQPERTDSTSLSFDGKIGRWTIGSRVFINRTRGLIDWVRPESGSVWRSANIASGTFAGIDVRGEWARDAFLFRVLYTWQKTGFSAGAGAEMKYHFYFPDHCLSILAASDFGPWSMSATLKIERDAESRSFRPYLGARLRRKIEGVELFADFQNLFNQRLEKIPGLREPPRTIGFGLAFGF